MNFILPLFILLPLMGFIISLIIPRRKEQLMSNLAFGTIVLQLMLFLVFVILWVSRGMPLVNLKELVLFDEPGYVFFVDLYFDRVSAVYFFVGVIITGLITLYSRYYMHRESGYKRFFNTVLFFYLGYTFVVIAGNLETLFIGWEILGIASFLLIAFYRNRYLPVKNAVKVFSVYRIGDVGLILAMWLSHHLWHENITFLRLHNADLVSTQLESHSLTGVFISLMLLLTAAAKSAQFPFSSWLPRAMEGPTPSSAIFYGSLSVHLGAFLLTRTFPFWEHQVSMRIVIGLVGLVTAVYASFITRVQSSIKSQIAYASMAQIGIIFVELALGLEVLALLHFAGNAFLRTYQLLVSPSVVSYLIREQIYRNEEPENTKSYKGVLYNSLYVLSIKEWNLESLMYVLWWNPIKRVGKQLRFIGQKFALGFFAIVYGLGLYLIYHREVLSESVQHAFPIVFGAIGLLMVMKAFSEKRDVLLSWILVLMNHFWVALAVAFNEAFTFWHVYVYLSGILLGGIVGGLVLKWLEKREEIGLWRFNGKVERYPLTAMIFLICCLAISGFPISPSFIGEDLLFSHIHENQLVLAFLIATSLILDGLAIMRIYARVFLGPEPNQHAQRSN